MIDIVHQSAAGLKTPATWHLDTRIPDLDPMLAGTVPLLASYSLPLINRLDTCPP